MKAPPTQKAKAALPLPLGLSQHVKPHPGFTGPAHGCSAELKIPAGGGKAGEVGEEGGTSPAQAAS